MAKTNRGVWGVVLRTALRDVASHAVLQRSVPCFSLIVAGSRDSNPAGSGTSNIPHGVHRNRTPWFSASQIQCPGNSPACKPCAPAHTTQRAGDTPEEVAPRRVSDSDQESMHPCRFRKLYDSTPNASPPGLW